MYYRGAQAAIVVYDITNLVRHILGGGGGGYVRIYCFECITCTVGMGVGTRARGGVSSFYLGHILCSE